MSHLWHGLCDSGAIVPLGFFVICMATYCFGEPIMDWWEDHTWPN